MEGESGGSSGETVLADVRDALDDDLNTPAALSAIDKAAAEGMDAGPAAALLGVDLAREVGPR